MNRELFRRDQVWFTQLNKDRATDLYSLVEIKDVRKSENLAKGYVSGKYGAIPMLNHVFSKKQGKMVKNRRGYMGKRNFDLMSRNENTREKVQRKVVRFEIRQIRQHFEESLCAIYAQFTVADDLWHSGKKEEAENIWRAQIIIFSQRF